MNEELIARLVEFLIDYLQEDNPPCQCALCIKARQLLTDLNHFTDDMLGPAS